MKTWVVFLSIFTNLMSYGAKKPYEVKDLFPRLEISGEILVFEPSGKRLFYQQSERKSWRTSKENGKIESKWGSEGEDFSVQIHHVFEIQPDGAIKAHVAQYAKVERDPKTGESNLKDLVREEDFILQDFAPITWVAFTDKEKKVVVRLTPRIRSDETPKSMADLPISGKGVMVYDSNGNIWSQNSDVSGKYVGLITSRGAFQISYYPFQGAQEIGSVADNKITLKLKEGETVTLISEEPFVPAKVFGKIYGRFILDKKTGRLNSVRAVTSNKESDFLEHFARK